MSARFIHVNAVNTYLKLEINNLSAMYTQKSTILHNTQRKHMDNLPLKNFFFGGGRGFKLVSIDTYRKTLFSSIT